MLGAALSMFAQAQITTKKEKLSDFTMKTTKIVMTGNSFVDEALRNAAKNSWILSPYEICSFAEFEALKGSEQYYFLIPVSATMKGEEKAGLTFLTLVKGGEAEDINEMLEVVSFPICAADFPSGREAAFLPAILDIIQNYVETSLVSGFKALRNPWDTKKANKMTICFIEDDLSYQVTGDVRGKRFDNKIKVVGQEEQNRLLFESMDDILVSYTVAPAEPATGSVCYKMLINARTHELFYYKKHSLSNPQDAGFLKSDINIITSKR